MTSRKVLQFLQGLNKDVEHSAHQSLPLKTIVGSGAVAGSVVAVAFLAVLHIVDVIVLRHFEVFFLGFVVSLVAEIPFMVMYAIIGVATSFVYLKMDEYYQTGRTWAFGLLLLAFLSSGASTADSVIKALHIPNQALSRALTPPVSAICILVTAWLYWLPWLYAYRGALTAAARAADARAAERKAKPAIEHEVTMDSLEYSRLWMQSYRELAALRRKRREAGSGQTQPPQTQPPSTSEMHMMESHAGGDSAEAVEALQEGLAPIGASRQTATKRRRLNLLLLISSLALFIVVGVSVIAMPGVVRRAGEALGVIPPVSDGSVTIWLDDGETARAISSLADLYLSKSPTGVAVTPRYSRDLGQGLTESLLVRNASDIVVADRTVLRELARAGALRDLSPLVAEDRLDLSVLLPSPIGELTLDGHIYALPLQSSANLLLVNDDIMEDSVAADRSPELWSDLVTLASSMTLFTRVNGTASITQLGFAGDQTSWAAFLGQAVEADRLRDPFASDASRAMSAFMRALDLAVKLRPENLISERVDNPMASSGVPVSALFAAGLVGMIIGDYSTAVSIAEAAPSLGFTVMDLPSPTPVPCTKTSAGMAIGIFSGSGGLDGSGGSATEIDADDAGHADAKLRQAWEFAKFVALDPASQTLIASTTRHLPTHIDALSAISSANPSVSANLLGSYDPSAPVSPLGSSDLSASSRSTYRDRFIEALLLSEPAPDMPFPSSLEAKLSSLLCSVSSGTVLPETAMGRASSILAIYYGAELSH